VVGRLRGGWCGKDSNGREGIGGEVAITNETATMPTCGAMSDLGQTAASVGFALYQWSINHVNSK
jgi:hypothetical protein